MTSLKIKNLNLILILTGYYPLLVILIMYATISAGHDLVQWMVMAAWALNVPAVVAWFILIMNDMKRLKRAMRINLVIQVISMIYALLITKAESFMLHMQ